MHEEHERSRLDQTRKSVRSRVTRQSLNHSGIPLDLTPVLEEGKRRFGKVGLGFATFLGIAALVWFVMQPMTTLPASYGESVASLVVTRGSVGMFSTSPALGQGRLLPLDLGTPIYAGAVIETGHDPGRAALVMAGGISLRLDSNTRVELSSNSAVVLDRGAVYVDSAQTLEGMEVRTTLGVVRDIGTQFEVRLFDEEKEESLRVRVREGKVLLRHRQEDHVAEVGEELAMHADSTLTRGTTPIYGPNWDWVLEVAPGPDLRSIEISALIQWLARETGKTFRFEDEETAKSASTQTVNAYVGAGQTVMDTVIGLFDAEGLAMREEEEGVVILVRIRE